MPRLIAIVSYESRLDNLFKQFGSLPTSNPLIQSHWSRYLCVLCYGYIETSIRDLLIEYSRNNAHPYIVNFLEKRLERFRNAKMNNILELLSLFNPLWSEKITNTVDSECSDAINSIADNRHKIAHGKSVGVSRVNITSWYKQSKKFISILEKMM